MRVELAVTPDCAINERQRPFYAQSEKEEVDKAVQSWWDTGVIIPAPTGCPYNNSLTIASRRNLDGEIIKYRVCLDPRTLNNQLVKPDNFPLPLVSDMLEKVAGYNYFSTFDLKQAYHRMPVAEESQPLTAFTYSGRQYMFARAPFGLKPLTSIFQRAMSELLGDLHNSSPYVDDIVVYSKSIDDHLVHCKVLVKRLTAAKLIINRQKCHLLSTQIVLLGFVVNKHGRSINLEKLANVMTWALPTNRKMVQRYLGMFNYFRNYIPLYSSLTAPLDLLRNARGTFELTVIQRNSFNAVRELIPKAPVLSFPNFKDDFYVGTDASNLGVGALLYQLPNGRSDESVIRYISFMSRALHKHEKNYSAYKKELLAVVFALNKFHQYLFGRHFVLYTDHRPLTYIHEQKELPQVIGNWKEIIFSYDFECVYRPGILNIIPDALSRAYPDEPWSSTETPVATSGSSSILAVITRSRQLTETVSEGEPSAPSSAVATRLNSFRIHDDASYVHAMQTEDMDRATVMDKEERRTLLQQAHEFGHLGSNAMATAILAKGVVWPKLREDCLHFVGRCGPCQHFNIARKGYHPLKAIHAELPGEHVSVDLATFPMSLSGNQFALIMVDICTRFVFLEALPNKEASTIAKVLFKWFCLIGFPKILQSDNGTEFVNEIAKLIAQKLNIDHRLTTPYHPRANGVAERHVQATKQALRKQVSGRPDTWDLHLPMVQLQLNAKAVSLHSSTPFSLFFGRSFAGLTDFSSAESHLLTEEALEHRLQYLTELVFPAVAEKSTATQQNMIERFNKSHRIREFPPGTFVMARDETVPDKMTPPFQGPYKVLERTTMGSYILADPTGENLPRHYAPSQLKSVTQALDAPNDESYEIEAITAHDLTAGGMMYTVKWKDYDSIYNSQLAYENFDSDLSIRNYWKKLGQVNPHIAAKQNRRDFKAQKKAMQSIQARSTTRTSKPPSAKRRNKRSLRK